jgi:hypothetical protein
MEFRAWDYKVNAELQLTPLEKGDPGWVEKERRRILSLRGAAGESGSEPAHTLFAQTKTAAINSGRDREDDEAGKAAEKVQWAYEGLLFG